MDRPQENNSNDGCITALAVTGIVALGAAAYFGPGFEPEGESPCAPPEAEAMSLDRMRCAPEYGEHILDHFSPGEDEASPETPTGKVLYLLGDSIAQGTLSQGELAEDLAAAGWTDVLARANCGRPIVGTGSYESCDEGRPDQLTAQEQIRQPEDEEQIRTATDVVIMLGTNDYARGREAVQGELAAIMQHVRYLNPNVTVHWVTTHIEGEEPWVNELIAASGAKVIDYAAEADGYYNPDCSDGAHPCPDGYRKIGDLVLSSIEG